MGSDVPSADQKRPTLSKMIETDNTVGFLVYGALLSTVKGWIDRINDIKVRV